MILELAAAASCDTRVAYNTPDFGGAEQFGVRLETAKEFLQRVGELK